MKLERNGYVFECENQNCARNPWVKKFGDKIELN
jgi:hypothetical protein